MPRVALLVALIAVSDSAIAASWLVFGPSDVRVGDRLAVEVRAVGDSATVAGQVTLDFDEAVFALDSGREESVVGINGGDCRLVGTRTIVVTTPPEPRLLPSEPTSFCSASLHVRDRLPTSITRLRLAEADCVDGTGSSLPCHTQDLAIAVSGNLPAPGAGTIYLDDSQYAEVMLRHGQGVPSVDEVLAFDIARDDHPIQALRGIPLLGVSALIQPRAAGEYRRVLDQQPAEPRSRLERYIVVRVPSSVDFRSMLERLRADPIVEAAFGTLPMQLPIPAGSPVKASPIDDIGSVRSTEGPKSVINQYHLQQLNLPAAWQFTLGWGHVGVADTGVDTGHLDLVPFLPSGQFVGGNFLASRSFDTGRLATPGGAIDYNVDEREAMPLTSSESPLCANWSVPNFMIPTSAGHGSHVAGLIGAGHFDSNGVEGVCGRCGIAIAKISDLTCGVDTSVTPPTVTVTPSIPQREIEPEPFNDATSRPTVVSAITGLASNGFQVLNLSFGGGGFEPAYCSLATNGVPHANHSYCLALSFAAQADVVVASAAGNDRGFLDFPAQEPNVVSVGGIDSVSTFWNDDPDPAPFNTDGCVQPPAVPAAGAECGSNKTLTAGAPRQEVVAAAKGTRSLAYRQFDWNVGLSCGDSVGGGTGDGIGLCTGTSMSAPIVAGILGIYRSVNPLVPVGSPENPTTGVRGVLASTTFQASANTPWAMDFGYGVPNVELGVRKMLGTVRAQQVRNRLVPLFSVYSSIATDYAQFAIPQSVTQLLRSPQSWRTQPVAGEFIEGQPTPGYAVIRAESLLGSPASRADAYVLTTHSPPWSTNRPLVPLYAVSRPRNWPLGCTTGTAGCNSANIDIALLSQVSQLEHANSIGYQYLGVQGFVFQRCTPEPTCQPAGTVKLHLQCNVALDDCAVFPEGRKTAFEAIGYTALFPTALDSILGYAYPNPVGADPDGDGLATAMEIAIGTNPSSADSDGDGLNDGVEFPFADVPVSDPCSEGAANTCVIPRDPIFGSSFESP